MPRSILAGAGGLLACAAMVMPALAQEAATDDRIDLPAGWQPEGVTALAGSLYVGSLADGAIWKVAPGETSEAALFAPGAEGRVTVGVEAAADGATIWAAGGPTGEVRAHATPDGSATTWTLDGTGFLNDVAATDSSVFVTDSFVPQLLVFDPAAMAAEPMRLELHGDLQYAEGAFNVNGIVATPAGLIVVQSQPGGLFRVDPVSGETFAIATDVDLAGGDGLELDGDILYVARNSANRVVALRLDDALTTATFVAELTHEDLDTPTTTALLADDLWVVNARFGEAAPGPETPYWLTRLDRSIVEEEYGY